MLVTKLPPPPYPSPHDSCPFLNSHLTARHLKPPHLFGPVTSGGREHGEVIASHASSRLGQPAAQLVASSIVFYNTHISFLRSTQQGKSIYIIIGVLSPAD